MSNKQLKIDDYTSFIKRLKNIKSLEETLKEKFSDDKIQIKDVIEYCQISYCLGVSDAKERLKDLEWDTNNTAYGYKVKYEIYPSDFGGIYQLFINNNKYGNFNNLNEAREKAQEHYNSRLSEAFYGYEIEEK